ncbi:hypothetical protein RE6C_01723 [Rhodopirellula europaea 6C]|uniref:Uncharacterized protein n=1 Tax=Rhodopirellula europaea 6C TaxID=1263867 RepID=M2B5S3_9BACT|nr:hypothetical protein RE6C_01723 [Rhodopirellula europaea 6C]
MAGGLCDQTVSAGYRSRQNHDMDRSTRSSHHIWKINRAYSFMSTVRRSVFNRIAIPEMLHTLNVWLRQHEPR